MSDVAQICTFTLNDRMLGIAVGEVVEILLAQTLTPVPLVHPMVAGLINMRGQIISAIDLRHVLRMPPRPEAAPRPVNIIVRHNSELMSLMVDQVGDVIEVDAGLFTAPPDTTPAETKSLFRGAFQLPDRLLLLFDTPRALETIVSQVTKSSRRAT